MSNNYYTHTTYPAANSQGASASLRGELSAIMAGFDLLPDPLGVGLKGFSDGTWENATIVGGTLDNVVVGGAGPMPGSFTTLRASAAATLAAGGVLGGTFTAGAGGALTGFPITGGSINNTPIGGTTPSTVAATTLAASGIVTLSSILNVAGALNLKSGSFELGDPAVTTSPFVDFHSSGLSSDYDARIIGAGGSATAGQGTLSFIGAGFGFSVRPTWAGGNVPWDNVNLPSPIQTTGGTFTSDVKLQSVGGSQYSPRLLLSAAGTFTPFMRSNATAGLLEWVNSANTVVNMSLRDSDGFLTVRGGANFGARPTWAGGTPWDNLNLTNLGQLANTPGFITPAGTIANATHTTNSEFVSNDAVYMRFHWQGLGGTPQWLWGPNGAQGQPTDAANSYLWNPAAFSVNYANSANVANSAGSVAGVGNPATAGSLCQFQAGFVDFGVMAPHGDGGGQVLALPNPYVVGGFHTGGKATANAIGVYGVPLKNQ